MRVDKLSCAAMVVRYWEGSIIVVGTKMDTKASRSVAEAKSIRWALRMAKLLKLVMEGDSRICFNALNKVMLREHGHTNP